MCFDTIYRSSIYRYVTHSKNSDALSQHCFHTRIGVSFNRSIAGAFFVQRGKGESRSALRRRLEALRTAGDRSRSRDSSPESSPENSLDLPQEHERPPASLGGGISRDKAPQQQNTMHRGAHIDPTATNSGATSSFSDCFCMCVGIFEPLRSIPKRLI